MSTPTNSTMRFVDFATHVEINWPLTFPYLTLGPHRDPRAASQKICADVDKLRSCSAGGRKMIKEDRCARVGLSVDGVPTFYIGRTRYR